MPTRTLAWAGLELGDAAEYGPAFRIVDTLRLIPISETVAQNTQDVVGGSAVDLAALVRKHGRNQIVVVRRCVVCFVGCADHILDARGEVFRPEEHLVEPNVHPGSRSSGFSVTALCIGALQAVKVSHHLVGHRIIDDTGRLHTADLLRQVDGRGCAIGQDGDFGRG